MKISNLIKIHFPKCIKTINPTLEFLKNYRHPYLTNYDLKCANKRLKIKFQNSDISPHANGSFNPLDNTIIVRPEALEKKKRFK